MERLLHHFFISSWGSLWWDPRKSSSLLCLISVSFVFFRLYYPYLSSSWSDIFFFLLKTQLQWSVFLFHLIPYLYAWAFLKLHCLGLLECLWYCQPPPNAVKWPLNDRQGSPRVLWVINAKDLFHNWMNEWKNCALIVKIILLLPLILWRGEDATQSVYLLSTNTYSPNWMTIIPI